MSQLERATISAKGKKQMDSPMPSNLDPQALRPMLQCLQEGEMTVARAIELLEMWLVGRYSCTDVPPISPDNPILGDDKFPMELVRELRGKLIDHTRPEPTAQKILELFAANAVNGCIQENEWPALAEELAGAQAGVSADHAQLNSNCI